jgi:hypothetical protein
MAVPGHAFLTSHLTLTLTVVDEPSTHLAVPVHGKFLLTILNILRLAAAASSGLFGSSKVYVYGYGTAADAPNTTQYPNLNCLTPGSTIQLVPTAHHQQHAQDTTAAALQLAVQQPAVSAGTAAATAAAAAAAAAEATAAAAAAAMAAAAQGPAAAAAAAAAAELDVVMQEMPADGADQAAAAAAAAASPVAAAACGYSSSIAHVMHVAAHQCDWALGKGSGCHAQDNAAAWYASPAAAAAVGGCPAAADCAAAVQQQQTRVFEQQRVPIQAGAAAAAAMHGAACITAGFPGVLQPQSHTQRMQQQQQQQQQQHMRDNRQHLPRNSMYRQQHLGMAVGAAEAASMQLRQLAGVSATTSTSSSTVV